MAALAQGEESALRNMVYQPPRPPPLRTKQAIFAYLSEVIDDENPKRLVCARRYCESSTSPASQPRFALVWLLSLGIRSLGQPRPTTTRRSSRLYCGLAQAPLWRRAPT
jgi:hypothetical protein